MLEAIPFHKMEQTDLILDIDSFIDSSQMKIAGPGVVSTRVESQISIPLGVKSTYLTPSGTAALEMIEDPAYNVRLGSNHIERLFSRYSSYPLAIAAYNAGPGNVNKWLRENGDPRTGSISWVDWIERIPFSETRNYVQRVLENAVVYEARRRSDWDAAYRSASRRRTRGD